ncbi:MAG: methylenetetrahydrofolate--tRNA-(uracil(54)-C(5))-methyltransferase (FADH(2)-oxidizing) TrmFO [Chloroflexi bacterium]|nr:methylenetetrahydrofolate--tRNA-(uracil(54)-C(5))-methyltransferase (FADH(2)-oxidizing) TrmFO [Chloroflexota bacterium]
MPDLIVIGGGLAGSEAAWQAAQNGLNVELYEMRPSQETGAHTTSYLAELVCSNSLGSKLADRATGLLQHELRLMKSLLLIIAEEMAVPAGGALAVDRERFAQRVTEMIANHPKIKIIRKELSAIPDTLTIIASGPLTSPQLADAIAELSGEDQLYFYDAISPILNFESIDMQIAFRGSRYERGDNSQGDYINCPLNKQEYENFVDGLRSAERIELREFEEQIEKGVKAGMHNYFEGCLPVEILAQRGKDTLAYGPMRPVGLTDPRTNTRPAAVVQLRQDNLAGTMFNMVGFQTNLKFPEQRRVFRMIPGLENAEFLRYGQMHRNTFIFSPKLLKPTLQFSAQENLLFAGQITGVEGYMGNIATGFLAGWNAARLHKGMEPLVIPRTTMLGSLCHYVTHADPVDFQPMKANFGIVPPLEDGVRRNRRQRAAEYSRRALADLRAFHREFMGIEPVKLKTS